MSTLIDKAFAAVRQLPEAEQDEIGQMVLDYIDGDAKWERLFADPRSEAVLAKLLAQAEQEIAEGHVYDCGTDCGPLKP